MDAFFGGDSRSLGNLVFEGARRGGEISSFMKIYYIYNINVLWSRKGTLGVDPTSRGVLRTRPRHRAWGSGEMTQGGLGRLGGLAVVVVVEVVQRLVEPAVGHP